MGTTIKMGVDGVRATIGFTYNGPANNLIVNMWIVPQGDKDGSRAIAFKSSGAFTVPADAANQADTPAVLQIEPKWFTGVAPGTYDVVVTVYSAPSTPLATSVFPGAFMFVYPPASVSGITFG